MALEPLLVLQNTLYWLHVDIIFKKQWMMGLASVTIRYVDDDDDDDDDDNDEDDNDVCS